MFNRFKTSVALTLLTAAAVSAATPTSGLVAAITKAVDASRATTEAIKADAVDHEALYVEAAKSLVGQNGPSEAKVISEFVGTVDKDLGKPTLKATKADASVLAADKATKKAPARAGQVTTGTLIEKDVNSSGTTLGSIVELSPVDPDSLGAGYMLDNIYNSAASVKLYIDAEKGSVNVPKQAVYTHSTYGEVSFIKLISRNDKWYISDADVTGTIDENGTIALGSWALMVTDTITGYYGACFVIMNSTELKVPNASIDCVNASTNEDYSYNLLIEQDGDNDVTIYGLFTPGTAVFKGRLTSSQSLMVSPQLVYNNTYYGAFYNYPATFTYDESTSKWKTSINSKGSMVFSASDTPNTLTLPGWVVSAKESPTLYVGYLYRDVKLTTQAITWPAPATLSFEGSGTSASPYLIKTAADITTLSQLVAEGNNFATTYFALANDIDMSGISATSFVAIGDADNSFDGIFDGKGYTISGLTADGEGFPYSGLFGYTGAMNVIRNLNISGFNFTTGGTYLGGVVGYNNGTIENCKVASTKLVSKDSCVGGITGISFGSIKGCSFAGSITGAGSAAGIAGQASCAISDCDVTASITTNSYITACYDCAGIAGVISNGSITNCWSTGTLNENYGRSTTGGIAGRALSSTIKNCFTSVAISTKRSYTDSSGGGDNYSGGILGYATSVTMSDCYSSSTIIKTGTSTYCGGIVGYLGVSYMSSTGQVGTTMRGASDIKNCYYSGYINSTSDSGKKGVFGDTFYYSSWTGDDPDVICFSNCYYDQQVNFISDERYGRNTSFFTSGLIDGFSSDLWTAKSGYYPTLSTVAVGTQAQNLASAPLNLRDGQTASKVKVGFSVTPADNITWALNGATDGETDALKMEGNNVTVKDIYSNSLVYAISDDNSSIKMYILAVVPKLFDGEGTEDDPYLIKTVGDFATLNSAVGTYAQAHTGDFFAMANDIDCTATDDVVFNGVGYGTTYSFGGSFDGRGHSVKNLTIDAVVTTDEGKADATNSKYYNGLFGVTSEDATIKNVVIDSSCDLNFYIYSGAVVGFNRGLVENCRNYATVNGRAQDFGGIVGYNYAGKISKCYNAGEIKVTGSIAGGITGFNAEGATVELCQNDGKVIGGSADGTVLTQTLLGGIAGYNYGTVATSVNNAEVEAASSVGGIVARNAAGDITSCVNTGIVTARQATNARGAIIGYLQSNGTVNGNVYDSSVNVNGACNNVDIEGVTALSTADLVKGTCPEALADAADQYDFTANSYPVLKAFADEPAAKALRNIYLNFANEQVRTNIVTDIDLSPANDVAWSLTTGETFKIDQKKLTVTVPTDMTVASDTLTAANGNYTKTYAIASLPVIFEGEGTAQSPFLIKTPADWNKLADFMETSKWEYSGNHFRITNDLDFEGDSIRAVAVNGVNFQGIMDGANHTIKNYVYRNVNSVNTKLAGPNRYMGKYVGIFGTLGNIGEIKNMTIDGTFEGYQDVAGLCGYVYGTISNVTHKGTVSNTSGAGCSGLAFRVYTGGSMTDCVNEGKVTAKTTTAVGIVKETQVGTTLTRCYNRGTVTSTTTTASGIANKVAGGLIDCGNEKPLTATGTICGIANTLDSTAYAVRCYNIADIALGASGSTANGLFNTLTARYNSKVPEQVPTGGYVTDCYNTGNLSGKASIYGLANAVNAGWKFTNCYNTGDVEASAGIAVGLLAKLAGGTADDAFRSQVDHCYNTGKVYGTAAKTAGIIGEQSNYTDITYSYNLGDITCACASETITAGAGLCGTLNGVMDHCFNAGNVTSNGYAVGGLVGYVSYGKSDYPGRMYNSFNVGDVVTTYTGTKTNGNVGGLGGYIATSSADFAVIVDGCYNAGNLTARRRVGGLFGGMFTGWPSVRNCYNSGKVICTGTDADSNGNERYYQSGTIFTNNSTFSVNDVDTSMLINCYNCFYDKTVFTGNEFRSISGSPKTTDELSMLEISSAFEFLPTGGYPVVKGFENVSGNEAGSIMLGLKDVATENFGFISNAFDLIAPAGTTWAAYETTTTGEGDDAVTTTAPTDKLIISNDVAYPNDKGDVILVATTKDNLTRTFYLSLDPAESSVSTIEAGKEVKNMIYVDVQGRVITKPAAGQVYIVRTNYTDGTYKIEKSVTR